MDADTFAQKAGKLAAKAEVLGKKDIRLRSCIFRTREPLYEGTQNLLVTLAYSLYRAGGERKVAESVRKGLNSKMDEMLKTPGQGKGELGEIGEKLVHVAEVEAGHRKRALELYENIQTGMAIESVDAVIGSVLHAIVAPIGTLIANVDVRKFKKGVSGALKELDALYGFTNDERAAMLLNIYEKIGEFNRQSLENMGKKAEG